MTTTSGGDERSDHNSSSVVSASQEWSDNTIVTYLFCIVVGMGIFSGLVGYLFGRYSSLVELKEEVIAEMNAVDQHQDTTAANNVKTTLVTGASSRRGVSDYTVLPVDYGSPSTSLYAFNRRGGWSRKPLRKTETFSGSSHTSSRNAAGVFTTPPRAARQGDTPNSLERDRTELNNTDDAFMSANNSMLTTTGSREHETMDAASQSSMDSFDHLTVSNLNSPLTPPSSSYKYRPTTPAEDRYGKTKAYLRSTMDNRGTPMSLYTPEKVRNPHVYVLSCSSCY